ncbi:EAL domain-containing protein [Aliikangiella sp. IMCC44359]|uniref:EAL domain-containing protein n=1 Tax=Aliikangiella sp. IMCC44359 TaxID=3459125 RepID=UPI00403A96B3
MDSIPSEFINNIEPLNSGYLLFSTDAGARLYTGYRFISVLPDSGEMLVPLNGNVYSSLEDSHGNLWFATDNGLYLLKKKSHRLQHIQHNPNDENSLGNNNVRKILEDSNGYIWFGTLVGVSRYSPETGQFKNYLSRPKPNQSGFLRNIHTLLEEKGKRLWIGGIVGLFYIDFSTGELHEVKNEFDSKYITSAVQVDDKTVWFGVDNFGIYEVDLDTKKVEKLSTDLKSKIKLRSNNIWSLFRDSSGLIWIGYWNDGIDIIDLKKNKTYHINYQPLQPSSLPNNAVRMITEDESGLIWIATAGGAASFNPATFNFDFLRHTPGKTDGINEALSTSFVKDNKGYIWIGTELGLERWDPQSGVVKQYTNVPDDDRSVSAGVIWKVREVDEEHLLLGTDTGIDLFNKQTGQVKHFRAFKAKSGNVIKAGFYDLLEAGNGWFYASSNAATIHLFNPYTNEVELVFDSVESPKTVESEYFTSIIPVDKDYMWLGSTTGLYRLNRKTKEIINFNVNGKNKISSNIINDLYLDQDSLWVATATGGINRIKIKQNPSFKVDFFSDIDRFGTHKILNFISKKGDKLWFTTSENVGYLDVVQGRVKYFPILSAEGRSFYEASSYADEQGFFYLGGNEIIRFNPDLLFESQFIPKVRFTGIKKLHRPMKTFYPLSIKQPVNFFPEDSLITFSFSGLDYAYPNLNKYQYKLNGVDKDWLSSGTQNSASYTHLPAGQYQFQVKASNHDGNWGESFATLDIVVHPPFWKSHYAYALYCFIFISLISIFVYLRKKKLAQELMAIEAVRQSESRLRDVLWGSGDELWQWDLKTNQIQLTNNFKQDSDAKESVSDFDTVFNSIHPDDQERTKAAIDEYLNGEQEHYEAQFRIFDQAKQSWRWGLSRGRVVKRDVDGSPLCIAGTRKDISDLKDTESQLRHLANYDQLTQLPNRSLFQEHLTHAINFASRYNEKIALLFFDLDGFKLINDSLGHDVGDQLLQAVAKRLKKLLRETEYIARLGGDEFTIIMERVSSQENIIIALERLIRELSRPFELLGQKVMTTVSIGIAIYPEDGEKPSILLKHADIAMYEAKRNGKKQYCFFESKMNELLVKRLDIEKELSQAIQSKQFETFYQPRVSVSDNQLIGFEALIRWHHPVRGFVSPTEFIPVAEETGQILEIGEWILNDACKQCAQWHEQGHKVRVSVNISALQFQQTGLFYSIKEALNNSKLPAKYLELEITEGTLIRNMEHTRAVILRLKGLGIHIALDDFGTGFSSLAYLQQLPIDVLKIDRVFINQLRRSKKSVRLSRAIINMAHSLDLEVVAEGIEEESQLAFLKDAGCEEYQGFLYGKPRPASQILF